MEESRLGQKVDQEVDKGAGGRVWEGGGGGGGVGDGRDGRVVNRSEILRSSGYRAKQFKPEHLKLTIQKAFGCRSKHSFYQILHVHSQNRC